MYLNGYGFPAWRGGPMFYADSIGLPEVVNAMQRYARSGANPDDWKVAPLLARLAASGASFSTSES